MNKMLVLLVLVCFPIARARALTVELFDIAGNRLSSQIDFDTSATGSLYHGANQYLKINNPGNTEKEIRIYAESTAWQGSQTISMDTYPLLSLEFPDKNVPIFVK